LPLIEVLTWFRLVSESSQSIQMRRCCRQLLVLLEVDQGTRHRAEVSII
jgi:hypothetical protein